MPTLRFSLFGEPEFVGVDIRYVEKMIEKYPEEAKNSGAFIYACCKELVPSVKMLPKEAASELQAFFGTTEQLRRRRQEWFEIDRMKQRGH